MKHMALENGGISRFWAQEALLCPVGSIIIPRLGLLAQISLPECIGLVS